MKRSFKQVQTPLWFVVVGMHMINELIPCGVSFFTLLYMYKCLAFKHVCFEAQNESREHSWLRNSMHSLDNMVHLGTIKWFIRTSFRHAFTFDLHANYVHVGSSQSATCQPTHMYALVKVVTQLYRMSHKLMTSCHPILESHKHLKGFSLCSHL